METKPWYASKTIWVNALALVAMIIQAATGKDVINVQVQGTILAAVNIFLRIITKGKITL